MQFMIFEALLHTQWCEKDKLIACLLQFIECEIIYTGIEK